MKAGKHNFARAGLICLLAFLPNTATARVYFSISLGTSFGHHHSGFYRGYYPHYEWPGGYRGSCVSWPRHSYWRRPLYSSRAGFWIHESYPIVIATPVRVEAPKAREHSGKPKYEAKLSERIRRQRSELLKVLKIGDKENRIEAICDLADFSFDDKVRTALEDVLLSDPDPELRKQVARLFGKTTNRNAVPALEIAKAQDSSRDVRQAAYRAIIMIEGY